MSAQTEPVPDAYFPALAGIPSGEAPGATSDYVCSPQTTIVASIISVIAMNLVLIVSFVVFYRYQRRRWMQKGAMDSRIRPVSSRIHPQAVPPPLPSRPSTASGALGPSPPVYNSSSSSEVLYKDPRFQPSERNFGLQRMSSGLGASSMTSLPRSWSLSWWCSSISHAWEAEKRAETSSFVFLLCQVEPTTTMYIDFPAAALWFFSLSPFLLHLSPSLFMFSAAIQILFGHINNTI